MATGVGLRVADDACTAAIVIDNDEPRYIIRESILHMSDDGDAVLGGPAPAGHTHSITGFVAAVGDPAGISVDDGEAYRAEDLMATALFSLINLTAEYLSGSAEFYATYPAHWPDPYVQSLREAMDYLGLRSVVLVSEAGLPGGSVDPGKSYACDAAQVALVSVLSTPAGATPPDPSSTENSTVVTDIMPALAEPTAQPQAYSAAIPIADPIVTRAVTTEVAPVAPVAPAPVAKERRRTPLLIAAAAIIGLALGGFGVALLLRTETETPPPPVRDAKSEVSVSPTTPPLILPPPPPTTTTEAPTTEPPVIRTTPPPPAEPTTTEPPPPPPPTTTTPPPPPSTTVRPTPPRPSTTTRTPFYPTEPWIPMPPGLELPGGF